jgi:hypothetical protein
MAITIAAIRLFRERFEGVSGGGGGALAIAVSMHFLIFIPIFVKIDSWIKLSTNPKQTRLSRPCVLELENPQCFQNEVCTFVIAFLLVDRLKFLIKLSIFFPRARSPSLP